MEQLVAFAASLVAVRLAGRLAARWRSRRTPELFLWSAALASYAVACAALAWGAAAGWDGRVFRVYYLFGGLLTAPLLGAGSLALVRRAHVAVAAAAYAGLSVGVVVAVPLTHQVDARGIPSAHAQLDFFPGRLLALVGNTTGTLAVVAIAVLTIRRRPLGNVLIVAGVVLAAIGSALPRIGEGATAAMLTAAVVLLYAGFVAPRTFRATKVLPNFLRGISF